MGKLCRGNPAQRKASIQAGRGAPRTMPPKINAPRDQCPCQRPAAALTVAARRGGNHDRDANRNRRLRRADGAHAGAGDHRNRGLCRRRRRRRPGSAAIGRDLGELAGIEPLGLLAGSDRAALFAASDVVIDFTVPGATVAHAALASEHQRALVIGTTGLDPAQSAAVAEAARRAPIVWAPNMSLGVTLLIELVEMVARRLGPDYDIEVLEMHHRHKIDAPSGTALALGRAAAAGPRRRARRGGAARPRRPYRPAAQRRHRLCDLARRRRRRRAHRHLRDIRRAARAQPQGDEPPALRPRRRACGELGHREATRTL